MAQEPNDPFDTFLSHSSRGEGGNFLGNWKKKTPPQVDVWMHTAIAPRPSWRHQFFKIETREDKDTRETERQVWSFQFNCHDPEPAIKKQYKVGEDGRRAVPPESCPMCRLIDVVRGLVADGRLSPLDPVFRFEGDDSDKAMTIVAAGLYGGFPKSKKDFAEEEADGVTWRQFRDAGLSLQGDSPGAVWKQQCMAKLSYVFAVVDNSHVDRGVQIAVEGALLGDKVKGVIADRRDQLGAEEGSFARNPCAVRWYHRPDEDEFQKKYHAAPQPLTKIPLTQEIEDLIREDARGVADRVNHELEPGDVATLRMLMEKYAVVELPFDDIFEGHDTTPKQKDSKDKGKRKPADDEAPRAKKAAKAPPRDEDEEDEPRPAKKAARPAPKADDEDEAPRAKKPAASKPKEPDPDEFPFECEKCGEPMRESDEECPKCGEPVGEEEEDEPAPKPAPKPPAAKKPEPAKKGGRLPF